MIVRWFFLGWGFLVSPILAVGQESPTGTSRALIIVGLPGDPEHDRAFQNIAKQWRTWMTGSLGFPESEVRLLSGNALNGQPDQAPSTRESILHEVKVLTDKVRPEDRVWVFVLGHANVDEGHGFLHLPGPDLRDDAFADAFKAIPAREQVFWLTTPASGWFLPPLSKPGRIVIAATERDKEFNETEFPQALAEVTLQPFARLDANRDGRVSVQEIFRASVEGVEARFALDKRLPTEHAQLDDNGDGLGTEVKPPSASKLLDGDLASKTFLPLEPKKP